LFRGRGRWPEARNHLWDALPIREIALAELAYEVALFEKEADEDVRRHRRRKDEVPNGHDWRCPDSDQDAQLDRVPDDAIDGRGAKLQIWNRSAAEGTP